MRVRASPRAGRARRAIARIAARRACSTPCCPARRTAAPLAESIARSHAPSRTSCCTGWRSSRARTSSSRSSSPRPRPTRLRALEHAGAEAWVIHAMDTYDREGLHRGGEVLKRAAELRAGCRRAARGRSSRMSRTCCSFSCTAFPDGRCAWTRRSSATPTPKRIYLPPRIARARERGGEFPPLQSDARRSCGRNRRYGTFNADLDEALRAHFPIPQRALALLNALETIRLEARIARDAARPRPRAWLRCARGRPLDSRLTRSSTPLPRCTTASRCCARCTTRRRARRSVRDRARAGAGCCGSQRTDRTRKKRAPGRAQRSCSKNEAARAPPATASRFRSRLRARSRTADEGGYVLRIGRRGASRRRPSSPSSSIRSCRTWVASPTTISRSPATAPTRRQ